MNRQRLFAGGLILVVGIITLITTIFIDTSKSEAGEIAWYWTKPIPNRNNPKPDEGIRIDPAVASAMVELSQSPNWTPLPVADDPLVRMPGTQPDQEVPLEGPGGCLGCHSEFDPITEPGSNWQGSMMGQAGRDFLYWAAVTVAGQDAIWAVGNPNATDICLRCHMTGGWLAGRSDPSNGSEMTGIDFDGVQCNVCHYMYDPFFDTIYDGSREGDDWSGYWDETNASGTPSNTSALATYNQDNSLASVITYFNGDPYFVNSRPPITYTESGSGQLFISTLGDNRRASFADSHSAHPNNYSRFHKSKYFCESCHDISNPVLHNLGADAAEPLPTESDPAFSYYHVERTFSEFMLSDYGVQGGAPGIGPFAPDQFETSRPGNAIASCQDCHMADASGKACNMFPSIDRPDGSIEHPNSGVPKHDFTGGNMWVSSILASTDADSTNYDSTNELLLNQGPAVLTLDLSAGEGFDSTALLAGIERTQEMFTNAAAIEIVSYNAFTGQLSFRLQNQTGHKLISGYPEGRRMMLNIKYFNDATLLYEVNPYDGAAGTLKGLDGYTYDDPDGILPQPSALNDNEAHVDELVYEMHGASALTGEDESFHFALSTGRFKDNRIPPKGFRIEEAGERLSEPIWLGTPATDLYDAHEYFGGYDSVNLDDYGVTVTNANRIEIELQYQTTSREYIEFLRNEINGSGALTLSGTGAGGDPPYIVQSDPFFSQLKAWGDTIWDLWRHNMDLPGGSPVAMATITHTVVLTNTPPVAQRDSYTTTIDSELVIPAVDGILENDTDIDGDALIASLIPYPMNGILAMRTDGSFVYSPNEGFFGVDSFEYRAYDGQALSNPVTVTITVMDRSATYLPVIVNPE